MCVTVLWWRLTADITFCCLCHQLARRESAGVVGIYLLFSRGYRRDFDAGEGVITEGNLGEVVGCLSCPQYGGNRDTDGERQVLH